MLIAAREATVRMGARLFCRHIASRICLFDFGSRGMIIWQVLSDAAITHPSNSHLHKIIRRCSMVVPFRHSLPDFKAGFACLFFGSSLSFASCYRSGNSWSARPQWARFFDDARFSISAPSLICQCEGASRSCNSSHVRGTAMGASSRLRAL